MPRKDRVDAVGALMMVLVSAILGFNQVAIKLVNDGLQPVFSAGLRSVIAVVTVWLVFRALGRAPRLRRAVLPAGLAMGAVFALEFVFLYVALDIGTVTRTSVIFYAMPLWAALAGHLLIPGERLTAQKTAGLVIAFSGVAWAILARGEAGPAPLAADLCALAGSWCWAGILLLVRVSALRGEPPECQLFWQVTVSAPLLLAASAGFGPLLRDPTWITWAGLAFQAVVVVSLTFALWFWLLSVYPAATVAAFGFLSPIFGVLLGWLVLSEPLGWTLIGALALVVGGLWLINRPPPPAPA